MQQFVASILQKAPLLNKRASVWLKPCAAVIEKTLPLSYLDKKKLAVVHIVKKELGLSEAEYRRILREITQVESAKDLDEAGFRKLMNYFVRSRYYRVNQLGLTIRQKLYIDYLIEQLGWEAGHLANFLHKYYHKSSVAELSKQEAIKVIESLKNIRTHQPSE